MPSLSYLLFIVHDKTRVRVRAQGSGALLNEFETHQLVQMPVVKAAVWLNRRHGPAKI